MSVQRPWMQPSRDTDLEPVREARQVGKNWFDGYNEEDADFIREQVHFPVVTFGGGRLHRENLSFFVLEDPEAFNPTARDPMWNHSITDTWAVHQFSPNKAHYLANFRRLRSDGSSYGMALSRLAILTKENGEWGKRVLSSCGLRNPESVEERSDESIIKRAKKQIIGMFDAYNDRDEQQLRDHLHDPHVLVNGNEITVTDDAGDAAITWPDGGQTNMLSMDVLPPQAGDKVVVDVNAIHSSDDGDDRVVGGMYLVTKQDDTWGVQLRSPRLADSPLP